MRAFLRSFGYAFDGIAYVLRTQRNARVHLVVAGAVVVLGFGVHLRALEWAVIAVTIGLVLSVEMVNSVAELAVDMLTQRRHPLAKIAKDVGGGAVLVAAFAAVGVGVAIFGPRLWSVVADLKP